MGNSSSPGGFPYIGGSPSVADGKVFFAAKSDNTLYAVSATTGDLLWNYTFDSNSSPIGNSSPALAGGSVYIGAGRRVYRFDATPVRDVDIITFDSNANRRPPDGAPVTKTVVCFYRNITLITAIENQGSYAENVTLRIYANSTLIYERNVSLYTYWYWRTATIAFTWNASIPPGLYLLTANATVAGDAGPSNSVNTYFTCKNISDTYPPEGTRVPYVTFITCLNVSPHSGDINADGKVDVKDLYIVSKAFGSSQKGPDPPGHAWNPNADIDNDLTVGIKDQYEVQKWYGWPYQ